MLTLLWVKSGGKIKLEWGLCPILWSDQHSLGCAPILTQKWTVVPWKVQECEFGSVVHFPTSSRTDPIRLEWFRSALHWANVHQTFLSSGTDSCAVLLPTHCHIVIVHVHGGDPGCHVGMISAQLFGFRNLSNMLVKALAKHRRCRSKADRRYVV